MSPLQGTEKQTFDPVLMAKSLSKHTDLRVFLANSLGPADKNLDSLPAFKGGSSISMWVDGKLIDKGISNVQEELKGAQIEIVEARDAKPGQRPAVLFAGSNTAKFRQNVLEYSRQGNFKDGVIAMAVCGERDDVAFNSRVIRESGAKAVIFYDQKINPTAVQEALARFAERLSKKGTTGDFRSVWVQSVRDVLTEPHSEIMKQNLEKLLEVLVQLSVLSREDRHAG
jgi:hypothetical protein